MKENLEVQQAENKIYYSKSTSGFYFSNINTEIPADKVGITQEHYEDLMNKQERGMLILADKNNHPVAVEQPKNNAYKWDGEKWVLDESLLKQAIADKKESLVSLIENKVLTLINQSKEYTAFDQQRLEAQIWTLDNSNPVPLLTSISQTIGMPLPELVKKCLEKTEKQSQVKGIIIGQEVDFKRKVKKVTTLDELEKIEQDIQNWK